MKERALLLGDTKSLVAIATEPPRELPVDDPPGAILISAGLRHRVGPNRLYVKIARRLASIGWPVVRFDLSGIGDSPGRRDDVSIDDRAVIETREVVTYLEARGVRRFVLGGLCSGADDAFRAAVTDPRVNGLILIDPCLYPSRGHTIRAYARRALTTQSWRDLIAGRSDLWASLERRLSRAAGATGGRQDAAWDWNVIPGETFREGIRAMLNRGVRMLLIYSPENAAFYNYRRDVEGRLEPDLVSRLRVECIAGADHTFTPLPQQATLLDLIDEWGRTAFS